MCNARRRADSTLSLGRETFPILNTPTSISRSVAICSHNWRQSGGWPHPTARCFNGRWSGSGVADTSAPCMRFAFRTLAAMIKSSLKQSAVSIFSILITSDLGRTLDSQNRTRGQKPITWIQTPCRSDPFKKCAACRAKLPSSLLKPIRNFGTRRSVRSFPVGGKVELDDMPRASAKFGYSDRMRADSLRAAQEQIGRELKTYYGPPRQIPHDMCVLLMQLKEQLTKLTVNRRQK